MKLRIVLHEPSQGTTSVFVQESILAQLRLIRKLAADNSAMDRGHRHSNGMSEICIWIKRTCDLDAHSTVHVIPPRPPPPLDTPPTDNPAVVDNTLAASQLPASSSSFTFEDITPAGNADAAFTNAADAEDDGMLLPSQSLASFLDETFVAPPAKRTRLGTIVEDAVFNDNDTLAATTLGDFVADVHLLVPTEAEAALAALANKCMESCTFMLQNSMLLQKVVTDSQPFLPHQEHQLLMARCSYLMELCNNCSSWLRWGSQWQDEFDAVTEIYIGTKADFEACFQRARASQDTKLSQPK